MEIDSLSRRTPLAIAPSWLSRGEGSTVSDRGTLCHKVFALLLPTANLRSPQDAWSMVQQLRNTKRDYVPPLLPSHVRPFSPSVRAQVLLNISKEELLPSDVGWDDLDASNDDTTDIIRYNKTDSSLQTALKNLAVLAFVIPPFIMVVIAAKRIDSDSSCQQPVATVMLLDGLLLVIATLGGGRFKVDAHRVRALTGTWLFPLMTVTLLAHVTLVAVLVSTLAAIDYLGVRDETNETDDVEGEESLSCSSGTYAWGMFFLVLNLLCLAVPPTILCVRCWRRITQPPPLSSLVAAGEGEGGDVKLEVAAAKRNDMPAGARAGGSWT